MDTHEEHLFVCKGVLRELHERKVQKIIEEATSSNPLEVEDALLQEIFKLRQELDIDPEKEPLFLTPQEWDGSLATITKVPVFIEPEAPPWVQDHLKKESTLP